ncbi:MAG: hypothetical protein HOP15_16510 [Planctomycetes bacterium]|nr:hypothetical protein [Planctomycetota bacterium]
MRDPRDRRDRARARAHAPAGSGAQALLRARAGGRGRCRSRSGRGCGPGVERLRAGLPGSRHGPRCEAFAPKLKEFYARTKPKHPNFEAVYLGLDTDPKDTRAHAAKQQYPGRVLIFDKRLEAADLADVGGELLPLVFLYDSKGKVLARNHPNGGSPSAADVLALAKAKLNEAR